LGRILVFVAGVALQVGGQRVILEGSGSAVATVEY
jgi:hypothetical protein